MLPSSDTIVSLLQNTADSGSFPINELSKKLGGATAAGLDPTGTAFLSLSSTVLAGLIQDKAVEAGAIADKKLDQLLEETDGEPDEQKQKLAWVLRKLTVLLPDGEQWDKAAVEAADGNPERLVSLVGMYQNDKKRNQLEDATKRLIAGDVNELIDEDEDFVDYLKRMLDVSDRSEALAMYLDLQDLLSAKSVQETLEAVHDLEQDIETVQSDIQEARVDLKRLLDRDLRNQGFKRIDETYYRLNDPKPLSNAWRIGIRPVDVRAGHGIDRYVTTQQTDIGSESTKLDVSAIVERLESGDPHLLLGRPGAGKSTFCRMVIDQWEAKSRGTIFFRKSGSANLDSPGTLIDAIRNAEGHVLVVVDDAARPESRQIYEVAYEFRNDTEVSFLLNARYNEYADFEPTIARETDLSRELNAYMENIEKLELSKLTSDQCLTLLEYFEDETSVSTGFDARELLLKLYDSGLPDQQRDVAGSMLQLVYELLGTADGLTGLEHDVQAKFEIIENPEDGQEVVQDLDAIDSNLRRTAGVLINLLNVAPDIDVRPTYLASLVNMDDDTTMDDIQRLISALDGWMVFEGDEEFTAMHEFWSFLYLRYMVAGLPSADDRDDGAPIKPAAAHRRFETCINGLECVFTGEVDLDEVIFEFPTARPEEVELSEQRFGEKLLPAIYDIGVTRPILAPIYQMRGKSRVEPETIAGCTDPTAVRIHSKVGRMLRKQGDHESAQNLFNTAATIIDSPESEPELSAEAYRLNQYAAIYRVQKEWDEAEQRSRKSLRLAREANDPKQEIRARNYLAIIHRNRGESQRQKAMYQQSLDLARNRGFRKLEASTLNNIGWMQSDRAAKESHTEALQISRSIGARDQEARALRSLGIISMNEEQYAEANEYLMRALTIYREIGEREAEAWVCNLLGGVKQDLGEPNKAKEWYKTALGIFDTLDHERGEEKAQTALNELQSS
jgi:tetratricopeptide (TPR) repeat protein